MTYQTKYDIGDVITIKDIRTGVVEILTIGQVRIMTLPLLPASYSTEYRSVQPDKEKYAVFGKWYPELWVLGKIHRTL